MMTHPIRCIYTQFNVRILIQSMRQPRFFWLASASEMNATS